MAYKNHTLSATLPDDYTRVFLIELKAAIREGSPFFARYGGYGMEPLLRNGLERVCVVQIEQGLKPQRYDILAIERESKCVFRRFLCCKGEKFVVMGDSCRSEELVEQAAVLGRVSEVKRGDGKSLMCGGDVWMKHSAKSVKKRQRINWLKNLFSGKRMKYWAAAYFVILLLSMWMPLGGLPLPDNFILGLRPDHFFHASIYCFCAFFLTKLMGMRNACMLPHCLTVWLGSMAIGVVTEFGQKLLPYRSFDINDLIANAIGATLGWLAVEMLCKTDTSIAKT